MTPATATRHSTEAIRFERVSVRFRLPIANAPTLKERAIGWLRGKSGYRDFWALRDVSFSVARGEVFGLVGHNGAGKSTLLRLVTQALRPTLGRVWVRGRLTPLLGLGVGFHPDLTGRENVLLTGTLLGHTRDHMQRRMEHIVDFSGLGEFIDAPARTFSSGMWSRLSFAIATDTRPDILIIDEVMSVGDEAFRKRCIGRMEELRSGGTTVFIVSHELEMFQAQCQRAAWLHHGQLMEVGDPPAVVAAYRARPRDVPPASRGTAAG